MTEASENDVSGSVEELVQKAVDEVSSKFKGEIAGLNRKNTELQNVLDAKKKEGQSIEERLASLESEKLQAIKRAETVEAFAHAGLDDSWRTALSADNPEVQAQAIKDLLEGVRAKTAEELSKQFNVDPEKHIDGSARMLTAESLKGKSPDEINKLWSEGRIMGVKSQ